MGRGRPKREPVIPVRLEGSSPEVQEAGLADHALNSIITSYNQRRAIELAAIRGVSFSDIARTALGEFLDNCPEAELLHTLAVRRLEFDIALNAERSSFLAGTDEAQGIII